MSVKDRLHEARRGLTMVQRVRDRKRAERALGRRLATSEVVHHHSLSQLVICQDRDYHTFLHQREDVDGTWNLEVADRFTSEALAIASLMHAIDPHLFERYGIRFADIGTSAISLDKMRVLARSEGSGLL